MNTKKMDVIVRKDFPLFKGETVSQGCKKLTDAGREHILKALNLTPEKAGVYMVEAFSTAAVFSVYKRDESPSRYYACAFKRDAEGGYEFSATQEVERVTSFQPKSGTPTLKSLPGWPGIWSGLV